MHLRTPTNSPPNHTTLTTTTAAAARAAAAASPLLKAVVLAPAPSQDMAAWDKEAVLALAGDIECV